jgi:hypothetical protein
MEMLSAEMGFQLRMSLTFIADGDVCFSFNLLGSACMDTWYACVGGQGLPRMKQYMARQIFSGEVHLERVAHCLDFAILCNT